VANLSLQYRTYPKTFRKVARVQYNIPMELPEAQRIHRTYQQTYPEVPRYWDRQIRLVKHSATPRRWPAAACRSSATGRASSAWKMESTSLNYPVQGTGGDQKYLAMQVIKPYLLSIGAYFAWDLHDGIYLWVPDDKVVRAAVEIKRLLANLPYREAWGFTPPIPLPWDCKFGKLWGTLKEFKDS
jgi:DNA polymerase I-like protein with 3'-5' exonuclease and polymerase domains